MVNKPLIRPYFWGGYVRGGGRLTSHEERQANSLHLRGVPPKKLSCCIHDDSDSHTPGADPAVNLFSYPPKREKVVTMLKQPFDFGSLIFSPSPKKVHGFCRIARFPGVFFFE